METDSQILAGDQVKVFFEHREPIVGVVVYAPCQPGDVWVLRDPQSEWPVVLGNFCYMVRVG